MLRSKPRAEGPFPPVNDAAHQGRIVDALLNDERVSLDRPAAEALAARITTRYADLVQRTGRIRDVAFRLYELPDGEWVRTLKVTPTFDIPWWHNTRIETHWADPAAPTRPWPSVRGGGAPVAALHTACADYTHAVALVRYASSFLGQESSDRKRGYSLRDDMARNGQESAGIAVIHELSWPDPVSGGQASRFVLARVLGNSRAAVRLDLLGLTAVDAAFGVPLRALRGAVVGAERSDELHGTVPAVIPDPADAWNRLMGAYETAWDAVHGDLVLPDGHERLADVDLTAVEHMTKATTEVVVAVSDPIRVIELVQKANIRDHLRGNQDLDQEARLMALGAEILDAHRRAKRINADEMVMLYGATPPVTFWPGDSPEVAEAKRRALLLRLVFPTLDAATRDVGAVMGEPSRRNEVKGTQINQRARVFTALATRGQHNARAGEGSLDRRAGLVGVSLPDGDVTDWIEVALADPHSREADALLGPLAITWLLEAGLIDAPRGSDPKGRRTAKDVIGALRANRPRAVRLVFALIYALASGEPPRQVTAEGETIHGTVADRVWFDTEFPATARRPGATAGSGTEGGPPAQPADRLKKAQADLLDAVNVTAGAATEIEELVDTIIELCEENVLSVPEAWERAVRDAVADMLDDLDRRPKYRRLRQVVGAE